MLNLFGCFRGLDHEDGHQWNLSIRLELQGFNLRKRRTGGGDSSTNRSTGCPLRPQLLASLTPAQIASSKVIKAAAKPVRACTVGAEAGDLLELTIAGGFARYRGTV